MAASSPDRAQHSLAIRASVIGAALGVIVFASGAAILQEAAGLLGAATGLVMTGLVALGAGMWAGAPRRETREPLAPLWLGAALATGLAGAFAVWFANATVGRAAAPVRIATLLLLVAFPVYRLGLLLPGLLWWGGEDQEDDEPSHAPLAAVLGGTLNGVVLGCALAGLVLMPRISPAALLWGAAVLLAMPMVFPEQRATAEDRLVYEDETPFGTVRVADTIYPGQRQPERVLYLGDEVESAELVRSGAPTLAYIAAAERWLAEVALPRDSYLFLGGGAYTLPRRVAERDPSARIAVVELNAEVTRIAERFFGLRPEHGITPLHGDARRVAESLAPGEWSRIVVDVYDGREALPYSLITREAFTVLERLLRPDGTLLINAIGVAAGEGAPQLWSTVRTVMDVFPSVAIYPHFGPEAEGRQNFLVAASREPERAFPARAGLFDQWPRDRWPAMEETVVYRDRFAAADEGAEALSAAFDPSAVER